jgi:hypothetical protein
MGIFLIENGFRVLELENHFLNIRKGADNDSQAPASRDSHYPRDSSLKFSIFF